MKTITLRDLPQELSTIIERIASEQKLSLNQTAIRLLEKGAGVRNRTGDEVIYHDLDHLAGCWSDAEADACDQALAEQRRVDPEV